MCREEKLNSEQDVCGRVELISGPIAAQNNRISHRDNVVSFGSGVLSPSTRR